MGRVPVRAIVNRKHPEQANHALVHDVIFSNNRIIRLDDLQRFCVGVMGVPGTLSDSSLRRWLGLLRPRNLFLNSAGEAVSGLTFVTTESVFPWVCLSNRESL